MESDDVKFILQWAIVILPVVAIIFAFVAMIVYDLYGEVWRPFYGIITLKKPLLKAGHYWADVFSAGNGGKRPTTIKEMNRSYQILKLSIDLHSMYRQHDHRLLLKYFVEGYGWVSYCEAQDYKRQDRERQRRERPNSNTYGAGFGPKISGWRATLGVSATEKDVKVIKLAYRKQIMVNHPDRGGDGKKIPILTKAIDEARKELNFV